MDEHVAKFEEVQLAISKKENQFFEEAFSKITTEIELYAKENGIRVVRSKQAVKPVSNPSGSTSVVGVAHPTLTLHEQSNVEISSPVPKPEASGEQVGDVVANSSGTLRAERINIVLTSKSSAEGVPTLEFSSDPKPDQAKQSTGVFAVFHDFRPLPRRHDVNAAMAQKEIIYASAGDEIDITPAIVERMNQKFEQSGSSSNKQ